MAQGKPAFGSPAFDAEYGVHPFKKGEGHHPKHKKRKGRGKTPPLGTGQRFASLENKLSHRGVRNPAALAAYIGRKKFGNKGFAALGRHGHGHR